MFHRHSAKMHQRPAASYSRSIMDDLVVKMDVSMRKCLSARTGVGVYHLIEPRRQKVWAALWACEVFRVVFRKRDEWKCGNAVAGSKNVIFSNVGLVRVCSLGVGCVYVSRRTPDTTSMPGIPDWFCSFEIRFPRGQNRTRVRGCSFVTVCCDYLFKFCNGLIESGCLVFQQRALAGPIALSAN